MMEKFAEDDRIEQMNQQRRRMKHLEHKRAVDQMIEDRRKIIEQEKEQERLDREKEMELEKYKEQVVEQERQRLLREHATKLVGFLPKVSLSLLVCWKSRVACPSISCSCSRVYCVMKKTWNCLIKNSETSSRT